MRRVSMATRDELIAALSGRYGAAGRIERTRILDEFVAVTGYHRKHAMRVLQSRPMGSRHGPRPSRRIYGEAVREALILLWEASDRVCGKRLKALLPVLMDAMERHGRLELDPAVRAGVLAMSAATIDRALAPCREASGTRRRWRSAGLSACVEDVDLRTPRGIDRAVFARLVGGDWIDRNENLLITGATGLGKSWIACALGHKACRDNRSVQYHRVPRLFDALALARGDGRYGRLLKTIGRVQLLILDDWGLSVLNPPERRDLLAKSPWNIGTIS